MIKWSDRLSVGVADFDAAHRQLIAIIDRLFSAHRAAALSAQIESLLAELLRYADEHFEHEEDLLRQHGYPGLRDQEVAHQRFVASVLKIKRDWSNGESSETILKLAGLLKEWLLEHIVGMDRQYQDYLKQRGIS